MAKKDKGREEHYDCSLWAHSENNGPMISDFKPVSGEVADLITPNAEGYAGIILKGENKKFLLKPEDIDSETLLSMIGRKVKITPKSITIF